MLVEDPFEMSRIPVLIELLGNKGGGERGLDPLIYSLVSVLSLGVWVDIASLFIMILSSSLVENNLFLMTMGTYPFGPFWFTASLCICYELFIFI